MVAVHSEPRHERLSLRLSPTDDSIIRAAAAAEGISITEFVLRAARGSATQALADRSYVILDADTWDALEARISEPARRNEKVAELFNRSSPFDG